MPDLDRFIEHDIRGNLFRDLAAMQKIEVTFPLLMSTCAGIELLGALLSKSEFQVHNRNRTYFQLYWSTYLYCDSATSSDLAGDLYQMVRNGIAHGFVLKGSLAVLRMQPAMHLKSDAAGVFCIDATQLASDFVSSFEREVPAILARSDGSPSRASMSQRFDEMCRKFQFQVRDLSAYSPIVSPSVCESAALSTSTIRP